MAKTEWIGDSVGVEIDLTVSFASKRRRAALPDAAFLTAIVSRRANGAH